MSFLISVLDLKDLNFNASFIATAALAVNQGEADALRDLLITL